MDGELDELGVRRGDAGAAAEGDAVLDELKAYINLRLMPLDLKEAPPPQTSPPTVHLRLTLRAVWQLNKAIRVASGELGAGDWADEAADRVDANDLASKLMALLGDRPEGSTIPVEAGDAAVADRFYDSFDGNEMLAAGLFDPAAVTAEFGHQGVAAVADELEVQWDDSYRPRTSSAAIDPDAIGR